MKYKIVAGFLIFLLILSSGCSLFKSKPKILVRYEAYFDTVRQTGGGILDSYNTFSKEMTQLSGAEHQINSISEIQKKYNTTLETIIHHSSVEPDSFIASLQDYDYLITIKTYFYLSYSASANVSENWHISRADLPDAGKEWVNIYEFKDKSSVPEMEKSHSESFLKVEEFISNNPENAKRFEKTNPETSTIYVDQHSDEFTKKQELVNEVYFDITRVKNDDVLNIRSEPNYKSLKLGEIPPDATGILSLEDSTLVGKYWWIKIQYNNISGWVNSYFLAESDYKPDIDNEYKLGQLKIVFLKEKTNDKHAKERKLYSQFEQPINQENPSVLWNCDKGSIIPEYTILLHQSEETKVYESGAVFNTPKAGEFTCTLKITNNYEAVEDNIELVVENKFPTWLKVFLSIIGALFGFIILIIFLASFGNNNDKGNSSGNYHTGNSDLDFILNTRGKNSNITRLK